MCGCSNHRSVWRDLLDSLGWPAMVMLALMVVLAGVAIATVNIALMIPAMIAGVVAMVLALIRSVCN